MPDQLQLSFVSFKKDAYIVVEGKRNADRFFIIHEGKVGISKEVEVVVEAGRKVLGPGDFIGVVSSMSSHSHIETAKALTDVVLISVQKEQYGELIQRNSPVAMKIILEFSKRLRYLDEALSRITLKNTSYSEPSHLFTVAEFYAIQGRYAQALYSYAMYLKYCPYGSGGGIAKDQIKKLAIHAKGIKLSFGPSEFNRTYLKDSMIFAEGEPGEELFIIQKGSVTITKIVDDQEILLAVLKSGDIFGEMALLEAKPRAASAVAHEECQVLAVNRANFEQMIKTQPQLIARLTTLLAERIWFIYKQLANTLIINTVGRMYDILLIQLEKNRVPLDSNAPYTFDFSPKELASMVGIPPKDANIMLRKMLDNRKIIVDGEKISTLTIGEIVKQTEFYRKMQKIDASRKERSISG